MKADWVTVKVESAGEGGRADVDVAAYALEGRVSAISVVCLFPLAISCLHDLV